MTNVYAWRNLKMFQVSNLVHEKAFRLRTCKNGNLKPKSEKRLKGVHTAIYGKKT
jgi:hypothetical protein